MQKDLALLNTKKVVMPVSENEKVSLGRRHWFLDFVEEARRALDRYRLLGRELEVEFARGDRKSK